MRQVPQDYARRWYVLDEIAAIVEAFIKRTPQALAAEIQRVADATARDCFRAEYGYDGTLGVFA